MVALAPYLERLSYSGDVAPTLATLNALHLAHATHIPFENIDVLLGRGIDLDPATLERKLVADRRGGYCFEHNLLFATVLETLGFDVRKLSARVRLGAAGVRPRTHMLLLVTIDGRQWIADVGFGSDGLLLPVPFAAAAESIQFFRGYRVVPQGDWWVMQSRRADEWYDLYAFTLDAHERVDYEVLNHYTSTHPRSIFRALLVAQSLSPERRLALRDRQLTVETADGVTTRPIAGDELPEVLRDMFGIELPDAMLADLAARLT